MLNKSVNSRTLWQRWSKNNNKTTSYTDFPCPGATLPNFFWKWRPSWHRTVLFGPSWIAEVLAKRRIRQSPTGGIILHTYDAPQQGTLITGGRSLSTSRKFYYPAFPRQLCMYRPCITMSKTCTRCPQLFERNSPAPRQGIWQNLHANLLHSRLRW